MIKHTFKYCATHKEDEAYMQKMCSLGWAAVKLVEGFWTFEQCEPNQYCYRICYLRGLKQAEIDKLEKAYAEKGIEFVSRYSFWAICRSSQPFELYTPSEDYAICQKIYAPMPIGAIVSWLLCGLGIYLTFKLNSFIIIPSILIGIYASVCTWLGLSYHKLLKDYKPN